MRTARVVHSRPNGLVQTIATTLLLSFAKAHTYPYFPTQILMPACFDETQCIDRNVAYIFHQDGDNVEMLSMNYSGTVDEDKLEPMGTKLPFLQDAAPRTTFGATRAQDGSLFIYAGSCSDEGGDVWTWENEGWVERDSTHTDDEGAARGPYFLGATMAFASTLAPDMDEPTLYNYGGMCSDASSDVEDWQATANYTTAMISLVPDTRDTTYASSIASSTGPRSAMAGFSLTPLAPSLTNLSGTVTQRVGYLVLGGHTQQAFLNMSMAAIWSLPDESWNYLAINSPDPGEDNDELKIARSIDNVYSRSGHSAVLSSDGRSIIVLGGWVGDVNTPAEPQLAILETSQTYDGWRWKIPASQPDDSRYGHAAAMLPGDIMMVYGGWEITEGKDIEKRQSGDFGSPWFLNTTSMEWSNSYKNPDSDDSPNNDENNGDNGKGDSDDAPSTSDGSDRSRDLGIGLGVGLGAALAISVLVAFLCWKRRQRRRRESRDDAVRALAQDARHFIHDTDVAEKDGIFSTQPNYWYTGGRDAYGNNSHSLGYESLRGSRSNSKAMPGPSTTNRKSVPRTLRGGYVPAVQHPTGFASTPGRFCNPILEDDEDEQEQHQGDMNPEPHTPTSEVPSDPFVTPVASTSAAVYFPPPGRAACTPSPENGQRHNPEVRDWMLDVDATDAMLARRSARTGPGRVSPTRRGSHLSSVANGDDDSRCGSTLSESNRSAADSLRMSPPALRKLNLSSTEEQGHKPGSSSGSSYNTAKSTFGALQAEGPSLLMGRSAPLSPTYTFTSPEMEDDMQEPGSPSKFKGRRGWLGSLKRVFSTSGATTPSSSRGDSPSFDIVQHSSATDYDSYAGSSFLSGELLRRKQGRSDWEEDGDIGAAGRLLAGGRSMAEENDWDVERAVEGRRVQIMFTVPREPLRVVNASEEDADDRSLRGPLQAVILNADSASSTISRDENNVSPLSSMSKSLDQGKGLNVRAAEDTQSVSDLSIVPSTHELDEEKHPRASKKEDGNLNTPTKDGFLHTPIRDSLLVTADGRRLSHSSSGSGHRETATIHTAQAVSLERPKTKVLQMVDSFESMRREASPERLTTNRLG